MIGFLLFLSGLAALFFAGGYVSQKIIKQLEEYDRDSET